MKIKWKLFITYSSLILLILLVSSICFYLYTTKIMRDNGYQSLYQTASSISDKLDSHMESLDQLATRIIFSDHISDIWFHSSLIHDGTVNQTNVNSLHSAVYSLAGLTMENWEICLYHLNGTIASMGMYSAISEENADAMEAFPIVGQALAARGSKVFFSPYVNPWNRQDKVFSVARCFSSELLSSPSAVIEVQYEYDYVIKELNKVLRSVNYGNDVEFLLLGQEGQVFYNSGDISQDIISCCLDKISGPGNPHWFSFKDSSSGAKMAASFISSSYTGWGVVTILPEAILFQRIHVFASLLIIISVFALICTMLVSYLLAKNMMQPLEKMHQAILHTTLPYSPEKELQANQRQSEPEALYEAYLQLTKQLQSSIERSAQMSIRETKAQLSALQAQMNPHFLYNTISSISILSEMGDSAKVRQTCSLLTEMMGYILSKTKRETVLEDEIQFARQYLELMKIRYEHCLEWEIQIPVSLYSIPFPRLVLQPLIENCMKYATSVDPPWKIHMEGYWEDNSNWRIRVSDNGPGFSSEYLASWNQTKDSDGFRYYDETADGLGLKNTRSRFLILYPEHCVFELSNLPHGGASILLGAPSPLPVQNL